MPMSKGKTQDRAFIRRTIIISGCATVLFSVLLFLLATALEPIIQFRVFIGPVITGILAITLSTFLFIGLILLLGNIREWYNESSGWFDIIVVLILVVVITAIGYNWLPALLTALLCIGFIYYLNLAQD